MLTPLDIQNKKFRTSALGYQKDEVEDFLELVLNDYESLYKSSTTMPAPAAAFADQKPITAHGISARTASWHLPSTITILPTGWI